MGGLPTCPPLWRGEGMLLPVFIIWEGWGDKPEVIVTKAGSTVLGMVKG